MHLRNYAVWWTALWFYLGILHDGKFKGLVTTLSDAMNYSGIMAEERYVREMM